MHSHARTEACSKACWGVLSKSVGIRNRLAPHDDSLDLRRRHLCSAYHALERKIGLNKLLMIVISYRQYGAVKEAHVGFRWPSYLHVPVRRFQRGLLVKVVFAKYVNIIRNSQPDVNDENGYSCSGGVIAAPYPTLASLGGIGWETAPHSEH